MIAGGGETGYHLARVLEGRRFSVLLLEKERDRCEFLAAHLKHATVVNADAVAVSYPGFAAAVAGAVRR